MSVGRHARSLVALIAATGVVSACSGRNPAPVLEGANIQRGHDLIVRYGCGSCHTISGINGANGKVGPNLMHFSRLRYIVGILRRTPRNTARWIQDPQKYSPGSVMPDLGVTRQQARDIAAYLYTQ